MTFELRSPAFAPGDMIPARYTSDGDDISPPLDWADPPDGVRSFALIADDPDAPMMTFVHWVVFNLPAEIRSLPEGRRDPADYPAGARLGRNGWRRQSYNGPSPPWGTHRYYFKLYALDSILDLQDGAGKNDVLQAMESHLLAQAELMGRYKSARGLLDRLKALFSRR
jgi:Raf kinase inhibitor-like YbhB/YbcL family protein